MQSTNHVWFGHTWRGLIQCLSAEVGDSGRFTGTDKRTARSGWLLLIWIFSWKQFIDDSEVWQLMSANLKASVLKVVGDTGAEQ
jgi:hypothetical protein